LVFRFSPPPVSPPPAVRPAADELAYPLPDDDPPQRATGDEGAVHEVWIGVPHQEPGERRLDREPRRLERPPAALGVLGRGGADADDGLVDPGHASSYTNRMRAPDPDLLELLRERSGLSIDLDG